MRAEGAERGQDADRTREAVCTCKRLYHCCTARRKAQFAGAMPPVPPSPQAQQDGSIQGCCQILPGVAVGPKHSLGCSHSPSKALWKGWDSHIAQKASPYPTAQLGTKRCSHEPNPSSPGEQRCSGSGLLLTGALPSQVQGRELALRGAEWLQHQGLEPSRVWAWGLSSLGPGLVFLAFLSL